MQTDQDQHAPNVVLRSSDGKSFYSHKSFLSASSPVFCAMFDLPQQPSEDVDRGCPVIDMAEDSCTLGHVLSLCHPISFTGKKFKAESVCELGAVLEATTKYDMEIGRKFVLEELTNHKLLRKDPVRAYALACQYKCPEVARLAAKHTLALPRLLHEYLPEFEKIHAGELCHLILYREACAAVACSLADDHTWVYTHSPVFFGCDVDVKWARIRHPPSRKYPDGRMGDVSVHTWCLEYMKQSRQALERCPHGDAVKDKGLVDDILRAVSGSKCECCEPSQTREAFQSFVDIFAMEVETRVTKVEINLGF